jgi:3'-phosphoadenosine 5'-phosphosulfate sulfotransferase (PAPS reductase)/FAD synthetase
MLHDRLEKIKSIIKQYGEENFYISFSGGKDSTVLSSLIDMALPDNQIPRVYADTGIELNMIRDFVYTLAFKDNRFEVIKPNTPIKQMLEADGYPFKSKMHSSYVKKYQNKGLEYKSVRAYIGIENTLSGRPMYRGCPKILKYQFTEENALKISDMCCIRMKEEPLQKWQEENNKPYAIVGIMREEGGRRFNAQCLAFSGKKLKNFQPLAPITKDWEQWFIDTYNIEICDIYKPPYNFERTGCKGCPFAIDLQKELDILEKFFPNERKQCEIIWKPVYEEYRRINYRLKGGTHE